MDSATVRGLTKAYPGFTLDSVSFSLAAGRITGFIGRNGAGKTTTIKSMLNLIHPDAGEISYFGMPLAGNEAQVKRRIGYSTGTIAWYPRKRIHTIKTAMARFYDTWDEDVYERYLQLFEIDENKCPRELSEGMKVKCNLLFALSHGAEILILDEPTSGLDPFSRDELLDLFCHIKQTGTAIFFSTHIISDIERCADDIVYLSRGRVAAACSKREFANKSQRLEESLEDAFLRLERDGQYA